MKQLFFFLFLISFSLSAQDFSSVDKKVKSYPKLITAQKLADNIASDFSSDIDKVRALFSWISNNIRYDLEEYYNPTLTSYSFSYSSEKEKQQKIKALDNKIVLETLSERKAVCEGYARVFKKVCTLLNIENAFIKGYVRNSPSEIGKPLQKPNHAWNAVKIDGSWKYFDATWGAGFETNGKWKRKFNNYYFDIPKEKLFFSHFPEETLWQLRVKRMSKREFYNQPIYKNSFLKTNLKLVSTNNGILVKDKNNYINIKLKNLDKNQRISFGFRENRYAKKAIVNFDISTATIRITPPEHAKEAFLIINNDVVLEFLIQ